VKIFFDKGLVIAASVAAVAVLGSAGTQAADLYGGGAGSLKDMPAVQYGGGAGRCYLRGDVGYSVSGEPVVNWPVTTYASGSAVYLGKAVRNEEIDNGWLGEIGAGCGAGSRGLRGDITIGYRGSRDVDGEPYDFVPPGGGNVDDPLHTSITSYTLMFNAYYDFGQWRGFVPYVGAGIGVAWHDMDEVNFTGDPFLTNRIEGKTSTDFAWSLMAGAAYQISDRAILDFGYRFIALGDAKSGTIDSLGYVNPPVTVRDMHAHEFKIGLRYHFGGPRYPAYK
jgi:opacity protein-like surface antigen